MQKLAIVMSVLTSMGFAWAQEPAKTPAVTESAKAKLSVEARAALTKAKAAEKQLKGLKGAERLEAIAVAARGYEAVAAKFGTEPIAVAQARFGAGELWRRHGSLDVARAAYGEAAKLDPVRFGERGLAGVADMLRRQKKLEDAVAAYRKVIALGLPSNRSHDARVQLARCLDGLERRDEALAAYRAAVESAATPRQIIDGCNWLAKASVLRGDLKGAGGALEHAEKAVGEASASSEERARLQKALLQMSARRALQRARDKASGAGQTARELDRGRG